MGNLKKKSNIEKNSIFEQFIFQKQMSNAKTNQNKRPMQKQIEPNNQRKKKKFKRKKARHYCITSLGLCKTTQ